MIPMEPSRSEKRSDVMVRRRESIGERFDG